MVDIRGFTNEQGIELRQAAIIVAPDEFYMHSQHFGRPGKTLQGTLVRGRRGFLRVAQHSQIIARSLAFAHGQTATGKVLARHLDDKRPVLLWDFTGWDNADVMDLPFRVVGKFYPQERRLEQVE
jgi:hypothetical protein